MVSFLLIGRSSVGVKMVLPIGRCNGCVLDRISAVQHDLISHINTHMRNAGGIVCADKEHQITGLRIRNGGTDVIKPLRTKPSRIAQSAVGQHIGNKAGAVKGCAGIAAAPNIWVADILFCFGQKRGKGGIIQIFCRDIIISRRVCDVLVHIL